MDQIIILLLILTSIVGLTFIVERGLALRWRRVIPSAIEAAAESCHSAAGVPMLTEICQQNPSPVGRLLLSAAEHLAWPKEENVDALVIRARHEVVRLERGLVILEIVVGIAPLMGLVGTIFGLIILFGELGREGMNENARLASGIALALRATLLGLLTAIPSLIAWSYYNKKVETLAVEMETICDEFVRRQYRDPNRA